MAGRLTVRRRRIALAAALATALAAVVVAYVTRSGGGTGRSSTPTRPTGLPHAAGTADYRPGVAADLFVPPHAARAPLVVLVPGGGWVNADRSGLWPLASWLAGHGIVAVTATYRTAHDGVRFPVPAADVECAVDYAVAAARRAGVDPRPVVVLGHSAGAHLAVLAALTGQRFRSGCAYPPATIDAAVGLAGPYEIMWFQPVAEPLIGAGAAADREAWRQADPVTWVRERPTLPLLLAHGADDTTVLPSFTTSFAAQLRAAGHPVRVELVAGADHGSIYRPEVIGKRVLDWVTSLGAATP